MIKNIALVLAFFMSFSSVSFAGDTTASNSSSNDGTDDVIEAFGGTRNGGDC